MFAPPAPVTPFQPPPSRPLCAARFGLGVLALAAALAGCLGDAERGNPLDPLSDNFRDAGGVVGVAARLSAPAEGVAGATVRLIPTEGGTERVAHAGGDGRFSLADVPSGTYRLRVEAEGFTTADTTVTVEAGRLVEQGVLLNALPRIAAQSVHSERINRFFPDPPIISRVVVEAVVEDPDGPADIARVDFVIPSFETGSPGPELFRAELIAVPGTVRPTYRRTFLESELPVTVQELLGRNLFVEARDQAGSVALSPDMHIVRIVEAIPVPVSPRLPPDHPPVRLPFVLTWEPLALPYTFTWRVELFFVPESGQEVAAGVLEGLPSSATQATVSLGLQPGRYSFSVKALSPDGVWSEQAASLTLVIKAPLWQKAWFLSLAVLCAG